MAALSDIAAANFARRLEQETDCADVAAAMRAGDQDFVLLHVVGAPDAYATAPTRRH
jgi:hypothetical protein